MKSWLTQNNDHMARYVNGREAKLNNLAPTGDNYWRQSSLSCRSTSFSWRLVLSLERLLNPNACVNLGMQLKALEIIMDGRHSKLPHDANPFDFSRTKRAGSFLVLPSTFQGKNQWAQSDTHAHVSVSESDRHGAANFPREECNSVSRPCRPFCLWWQQPRCGRKRRPRHHIHTHCHIFFASLLRGCGESKTAKSVGARELGSIADCHLFLPKHLQFFEIVPSARTRLVIGTPQGFDWSWGLTSSSSSPSLSPSLLGTECLTWVSHSKGGKSLDSLDSFPFLVWFSKKNF